MRILLAILLIFSTHNIQAEGMTEDKHQSAIFAGGCFWCVEAGFDLIDGVISTTSGYSGGDIPNPTYKQISSGKTKHKEVLKVVYDPTKVSYEFLLDVFWQNIDPTDRLGQFFDRGPQYQTAIFYKNDQQKTLAEKSLAEKQKMLTQKIVTEILPEKEFYEAEIYHQDYYKKNPARYESYKKGSGREKKLKSIWGDFKDFFKK